MNVVASITDQAKGNGFEILVTAYKILSTKIKPNDKILQLANYSKSKKIKKVNK